jgi:hypothetical protein
VAANDVAELNAKAAGRIGTGAWLGLGAAILAVFLPSLSILLAKYGLPDVLPLGTAGLQTSGTLVLLGAILFVLSLFLYRRGFASLRKLKPEFSLASALCLIGSVGFILILVAAAVLTGTASNLETCIQGRPSHALSCLESNQPLGAYTALVGFALGWLGGLGIALGLSLASTHYKAGAVGVGSGLYLLFLLLALAPFVALFYSFSTAPYLLVALPFFAIAAPASVLAGVRSWTARQGAAT